MILTLITFPFSITGVNTACAAFATPTNCKSSTESTVVSYSFNAATGALSWLNKSVKVLSSTIKLSLRIKLVLSINCFSASKRLTNQLCLGLFNAPYFCFALSDGSGTIRICSSYPTKLSNHFLIISLLGWLVSNPSVTSWYWLWMFCVWFSIVQNCVLNATSVPLMYFSTLYSTKLFELINPANS